MNLDSDVKLLGKERLRKILQHTSGFLYYVSVMGITGTKKPSINEVRKSLTKIRKIRRGVTVLLQM